MGHASACGGRMDKRLMAERSGGSLDLGEVVRVVVKLIEMDI